MKESYRAVANPAYAKAMSELRRSNAAGTHGDRRRRRERTRQASLKADLKREAESE